MASISVDVDVDLSDFDDDDILREATHIIKNYNKGKDYLAGLIKDHIQEMHIAEKKIGEPKTLNDTRLQEHLAEALKHYTHQQIIDLLPI